MQTAEALHARSTASRSKRVGTLRGFPVTDEEMKLMKHALQLVPVDIADLLLIAMSEVCGITPWANRTGNAAALTSCQSPG